MLCIICFAFGKCSLCWNEDWASFLLDLVGPGTSYFYHQSGVRIALRTGLWAYGDSYQFRISLQFKGKVMVGFGLVEK